MASERRWAEKISDILQWILILGKGETKMETEGGAKTNWLHNFLLSLLHPFSDQDEVLWSQLLNFLSGLAEERKAIAFLKALEETSWDSDVFRIRLIKDFQDSAGKKHNPNSGVKTLRDLLTLPTFEEQVEFAKGKKLLTRKWFLKRWGQAVFNNKLATLLWVVFIIMLFVFGLKRLFA